MKKLFQLFKIQSSLRIKKSSSKGTLAGKRAGIKTEIKTCSALPMTFDFTAYFDDNESESISEDIPFENTPSDTDTKILCLIDEKCNEMLYSSNSQQFECCVN